MGCQEKFGTGKIHEVILLLSSGQLFSESYQGKIVTGSVSSSLNFTWTMSRSFQGNYCGIGSHSHFFWFCTTIPIDVYIRQASSSVSPRSIYWKSSLCNVFLNMSIWNLQYLKMQMGKRKLQGLLWQQTSGRH